MSDAEKHGKSGRSYTPRTLIQILTHQDSTYEGQENAHLSPTDTHQSDRWRRRSASLTPSVRSGRSGLTILEDKPEFFDGAKPKIKREKTLRVDLRVSWLDLIKALFSGPRKFSQTIARRVKPEFEEVEPEVGILAFKDRGILTGVQSEDPGAFMVTVSVFPRENPIPERHMHGRCTFDTGCLQGNIISLDFARRLGFTTFEELKPRERNGGITALGNTVKPEGAIRISWYHSTSSQVFKGMRFLVLANTQVDLLIGVHSILKYNLIQPPNFELQEEKTGVIHVKAGGKLDNYIL
jgi:hypothetical protein